MIGRSGAPGQAASHHDLDLDSPTSNGSTSSTLRDIDLGDRKGWSTPERWSFDGDQHDQPLLSPSTPVNHVRRVSSPLSDDEESQTATREAPASSKTASWRELPMKGQLALLTMSRLAEPLTQTSLQSYMFYQLKSFDPTQTDDAISSQAGLLAAGFTAAQFVTAMAWGRAADSELFGRKRVILIGLLGAMVSALGFGFSKSFAQALAFRVLGGALNGNVGVMRTMISEIIKEKRFQSRAFMLLPMTFNIGVIIGPILGGVLSNPIVQYPSLFGDKSTFGGATGVWWMVEWPYALPNIVSAVFLFASALMLYLGLDETHQILRNQPDRGRQLGSFLMKTMSWRKHDSLQYAAVSTYEIDDVPTSEMQLKSRTETMREQIKSRQKLPLSRIWTKNVIINLAAHFALAFHVGTFNSLWFIFLSTPRFDQSHPGPAGPTKQSFPFHFNGGLALPPARIGMALSILGFLGIFVQLLLYPRWSGRLGLVRSYRYSLALFPICYVLVPYLAVLPSTTKPPEEARGIIVWVGITVVLSLQVMARTFALPAANILVNNACPHPSILGTFHGIAQTFSSGSRTIGPAFAGWLYGRGLVWGVVGSAFWALAVAAMLNNVVGIFVREGDGHEIKLEDEEDEGAVDGASVGYRRK